MLTEIVSRVNLFMQICVLLQRSVIERVVKMTRVAALDHKCFVHCSVKLMYEWLVLHFPVFEVEQIGNDFYNCVN